MAEYLSINEIRKELRSTSPLNNPFKIIKNVSSMINNPSYNEADVQELVLRLLNRKNELSKYSIILNALAREIGLFPYLNKDELGLGDLIAYEYHTPQELNDIVFHRVQAEVYRDLLSGKNVILSAPTSFGKSIIIDALIATNKFNNIVIVVPTIALIDETRRRLSRRFRNQYKVITHHNQMKGDKNLFILTQERVMEFLDENEIDFFVIDEFYKINTQEGDDERSIVLNQAFYKLYKTKSQFYLLGPNIEHISGISPDKIEFVFKKTDYKTVVTEYYYIDPGDLPYDKLIKLINKLSEPTLIYCRSPASVNKVAYELIKNCRFSNKEELRDAAEWIRKNYHPKWLLADALEKGIGMHHGKIPRALSQFFVREFNLGVINYLVCTSTIIEGVNTSAKNVVIFDNKIAMKKIDYFTFNNIAGRSGRMFKHFIGNVYLFHTPPDSKLPTVDFPLFSQKENTPDRLLLQMNFEDLDDISKEKIKRYKEQDLLSMHTLIANSVSEPADQIGLAAKILSDIDYFYPNLYWTNMPRYEQLKVVCELIWEFLVKSKDRQSSIYSGSQLTYKIWKLILQGDVKAIIEEETKDLTDIDAINGKIEDSLDFIRLWAMYKFPRLLLVLDSIQKDVFSKKGLEPGDYAWFANYIENFFLDPSLIALDEFGLPIQVSNKLVHLLKPNRNLDEVLERLKNLNVEELPLDKFEKTLLLDTIDHL